MCSLRLLELRLPFPQISHRKGYKPPCAASCRRRKCSLEKLQPHCKHVCLLADGMTESEQDVAICKDKTSGCEPDILQSFYHKSLNGTLLLYIREG